MGFAQTASVGRNLTMEYVRRVDASPREDLYERSGRNLVDGQGVFIAIFFIARRAGKVTTLSPARFCSWPGVEEKQLWWPVCALFCQRSSRNVVDDKGVAIANFFIGGRLGKTTSASILDTFPFGWVPFCTSRAAWAVRWVRASILGRFLDGSEWLWEALGPLWAPLGHRVAARAAEKARKIPNCVTAALRRLAGC